MQAFGLARLGRDAALRSTPQGDQVATLSLAFAFGRKGQDGKRPVQWVEGALWGKRAEALQPYLTKGSQVAVTLEDVHIQTFKRQDGAECFKLVGRVEALDLAGGAPQAPAAPPPAPRPAPKPPGSAGSGFDDMDDDIPF